jgi:hypothetical protein
MRPEVLRGDTEPDIRALFEVQSVTFSRNVAAFRGIIFIGGCVAKIYDSGFDDNEAGTSGSSGYGGGAFYVIGSSMEISGSTFKGNKANQNGGGAIYAIFMGEGTATNVTLSGCTFLGNPGSVGENDVTRDDSTTVTFACGSGTVGAPVTMKELEITNPPPTSLKCTIANCFCRDSKCVVDPTATLPCTKCETPGACV